MADEKIDGVPPVTEPTEKEKKLEADLLKANEDKKKLRAENVALLAELHADEVKKAKLKFKADKLGEEYLKPYGVKPLHPEDIPADNNTAIPTTLCPMCENHTLLLTPDDEEDSQ